MKYERKKEREERGGRYRKLTITVLELKEIGGNTSLFTGLSHQPYNRQMEIDQDREGKRP